MSNEKTRIFCVITQGELGGAQQFIAQLGHHLDKERFDLHVVWGQESGTALARHLPPHVSHATARYLVRSVAPLSDIQAIWELRRMMTHYHPDVVLCISSKAGFVGSRAADGLRKHIPGLRVIYRIGGWTFNDPWPAYKRTLYIFLEKLSAKWKDYIVVNNTHDLDQARMLGIRPRTKTVRIFNGIDPYLDFLPREQARTFIDARIHNPTPYEYLVGTVANLYPAKDIGTLVRAASRVSPNVRFVVIGDGALHADLVRQIAEYELEDRFFLVGSLQKAHTYLGALDVFVLPSVKEGFPWAVLEAMAAKVPIVATRVGAIPEMLEHGKSGLLIDPRQPDQMAKAIVQLLESDRLRQDVAIAAHQQLITRFSLREMVTQFEKLFTE
jgi:glycosyltransferase involved in cell wall biosynthesis